MHLKEFSARTPRPGFGGSMDWDQVYYPDQNPNPNLNPNANDVIVHSVQRTGPDNASEPSLVSLRCFALSLS